MYFVGMELIWLLLLSISDLKTKTLPFHLIGLGLVGGITKLTMECMKTPDISLISICTMLLPGILFIIVAMMTEMIGNGDGPVLLALGLLEGGTICLSILLIALLIGSGFCIVMLIAGKATKRTSIPFLPFLFLGRVALMVI